MCLAQGHTTVTPVGKYVYIYRAIVADASHRFTVINMNDTHVPIGQIHSFH